jgi:hypothetical protein
VTDAPKVPAVLDAIADVVLRYQPADKGQSAAKKRKSAEKSKERE